MNKELKELALEILNRGLTIATVENCTCGLLGATIGSVCAVPTIYKGTLNYFNDDALKTFMGIGEDVIEANGLYSSQVAMKTALYASYMFNVDVCISVIGDAFIHEDSENGTIWICVCKKIDGRVTFKYVKIEANSARSKNIEKAIAVALISAVEHIRNNGQQNNG